MVTWKVIMIICAAGDPTSCITVEDEWGPWDTKEQCEQRAMYMAQTSLRLMPPADLWWKCEKDGIDT